MLLTYNFQMSIFYLENYSNVHGDKGHDTFER